MKKTYCFALHLWYWIYLIIKRMSFSRCLGYLRSGVIIVIFLAFLPLWLESEKSNT